MACSPLKTTSSIGKIRVSMGGGTLLVGISAFPLSQLKPTAVQVSSKGIVYHRFSVVENSSYSRIRFLGPISKKMASEIPRCSNSSNSTDAKDESSDKSKVPFGYTRKDVLLIGLGVTFLGIGLKSGLEYFGVDPLQAGNVVQLLLVLGLTVGWISTYIFRVSNKEMTYAQQLREYERKVMEKRLEGLTEAELEALLQQVEEEKQRLASEPGVPGNDVPVAVDKELGDSLAVQGQLPSPPTPASGNISATGHVHKFDKELGDSLAVQGQLSSPPTPASGNISAKGHVHKFNSASLKHTSTTHQSKGKKKAKRKKGKGKGKRGRK